jgi:hypothetical protein
MIRLIVVFVLFGLCLAADNKITEFENPSDCGNQANNWKACIDRKIADQVFGSCCERFVPPECRGLCIYETHPIEARVIVGYSSRFYINVILVDAHNPA